MSIVLLLFAGICLYKTRLASFNGKYIGRNTMIQINGVFVFLVLISHFSAYLPTAMPYSYHYLVLRDMLGQLVVTTFLFYSGYGIMESIRRKGVSYIKIIPIKLLELVLNFSIAIMFFVFVGMYMNNHFDLNTILLSCIGWESVGNSNWYLFDIILLYAISYVSFKVASDNLKKALLLMFVFSLISIAFLMKFQDGMRWYNTFLCYFAGMLYSCTRKSIDSVVMKNWISYIVTGIVLFIVYYFLYTNRTYLPFYILHAIVFCLIINWISMMFHLDNPILIWLGNHIFSIYILQRIPMLLGKYWG